MEELREASVELTGTPVPLTAFNTRLSLGRRFGRTCQDSVAVNVRRDKRMYECGHRFRVE